MISGEIIGLIIFSFVAGMATLKIVEFFMMVDMKDERDDIIDKTKQIVSDLQIKLKSIKERAYDLQGRLLQTQHELTETQLRLDDANEERTLLRKKLNESSTHDSPN